MLTTGRVAVRPVYWILWLIYRSNGLRSCSMQLIPSTPGKPRRKTALRWGVRTFGVLLCLESSNSQTGALGQKRTHADDRFPSGRFTTLTLSPNFRGVAASD